MAGEIIAGTAIVEGKVYVRVRGLLRSVYFSRRAWMADVRLAGPHEDSWCLSSVRLIDVRLAERDDLPA
jgi:hypothetical protein